MDRSHETAAWASEGESAHAALTAPDAIRLDYLAPPPELQPFVTTFFLFRCDEEAIRDIQPASVGQLQVFLRGQGTMHYPDGRSIASFPETLQGPHTVAAPFEVAGPFHSFGAALSPLGWGALARMPANRAADTLHDAKSVLGAGFAAVAQAVRALYDADPDMDGAALVPPVAEFLRTRLKPVPAGHVGLLRQVSQWMASGFNPPVSALYAASDYSPRQVQRLVAHYCGSTPSHLLRIYRATRVAALLAEPGVSDERVAELTDAFYDQSHMIREIRLFAGRTPSRLLGDEDTILRALLDVRNFRSIKPSLAPIPRLETGGDEA